MTAPLDFVVEWVRRLLGIFPDSWRDLLWFPVFLGVLIYASRVLIRQAMPWFAKVAEKAVNAGVAVAAVPVMAILVTVAAPMRRVRLNPPNFVLAIDDAVVSVATVTASGLRNAVTLAGRLAKTHMIIIMALVAVVVWRWNAAQCEPSTVTCVTPIIAWAERIGIGSDAQTPAPTDSPVTPTDLPTP